MKYCEIWFARDVNSWGSSDWIGQGGGKVDIVYQREKMRLGLLGGSGRPGRCKGMVDNLRCLLRHEISSPL